MGVKPIRKVRLSEGIVDAIKEMIAADGFAPGDKFYSENELTAKLKVGRPRPSARPCAFSRRTAI